MTGAPPSPTTPLIRDVFNINGRKIIVYSGLIEDLRIGDPILIRSPHGMTSVAKIGGIELINYRNPADHVRGQGGVFIYWEGPEITDSELKGSTFSKAPTP